MWLSDGLRDAAKLGYCAVQQIIAACQIRD